MGIMFGMKILPIAQIRANLSALLREVESGDEIGISFGRKKEPIAVIVPISEYRRIKERSLGTLESKATVGFTDDWSMTDEELLKS